MTESQKHKDVKIKTEYVSDWEFLEEGLRTCDELNKKDQLAVLNMTLQYVIKKLKSLDEEKDDMEKRSKDLLVILCP